MAGLRRSPLRGTVRLFSWDGATDFAAGDGSWFKHGGGNGCVTNGHRTTIVHNVHGQRSYVERWLDLPLLGIGSLSGVSALSRRPSKRRRGLALRWRRGEDARRGRPGEDARRPERDARAADSGVFATASGVAGAAPAPAADGPRPRSTTNAAVGGGARSGTAGRDSRSGTAGRDSPMGTRTRSEKGRTAARGAICSSVIPRADWPFT